MSVPGLDVYVDATNMGRCGLAGCYGKVHYPAGVRDAVVRIREAHPDAVTLNETCSGDVAQIAGRTGYHPRFSKVIYYGKRLSCVHPGGRGLFGDVLTRAPITSSDGGAFDDSHESERLLDPHRRSTHGLACRRHAELSDCGVRT